MPEIIPTSFTRLRECRNDALLALKPLGMLKIFSLMRIFIGFGSIKRGTAPTEALRQAWYSIFFYTKIVMSTTRHHNPGDAHDIDCTIPEFM